MKTILLLTDFSNAATHAVHYACLLARQLNTQKIILYHSYHAEAIYGEAGIALTSDNPAWQLSLNNLEELKDSIKSKLPPETEIYTRTDIIGLNDINTVMAEENAELIVMGTAGKTKLEEIILGSSAIAVCKHSEYPVLLVPKQAVMEPIKHIAFACDLQEVEKTIPVQQLKKLFADFNVPLTIVNIADENKYFAPDTRKNSFALHDMLKEYAPSYYNSNSNNVVEGIMEFAGEYPSTMIVLISRRHNFMEGLFYRSFTRKLSYISPFPLLIIRENKH
jgi:nucleotide-binding universal stress UspA family protein